MILLAAGILVFLMSVVLHEVAHGLVAYRLGDPTAKRAGRLTLNPLKHIDPFWTVVLPGLLFFSTQGRFAIGMAKPVPVDFSRLRNPRRDMIWVALAGPLTNILIAVALNLIFKFYPLVLLYYAIVFNLGIAIFNLIPIPPLDGSRILAGLLPPAAARPLFELEPYGFLIVGALYFSGILWRIILPVLDVLCVLFDIPRLYG